MENSEPVQSTIMDNNCDTTQPENQIELVSKSRANTRVTIALEPGAVLNVTVKQMDENGKVVSLERKDFINPIEPSDQFNNVPISATSDQQSINKVDHPKNAAWQMWLIVAALAVYLVTRFIGLDAYPIYFFTDEAVQTVLAADLVRDGFHDYKGELLPTYLVNGGQYNLGTSVYLQILPWLMFGKSIWVTRGTSVLMTLLAALGIGLTLKNHFKTKYAFAGILILAITPAWFLHSRTAFETVIAASFYAVFLYCYLQYRQGQPKYLYAAVVFGALCFYSYSPAQMVMAVSAVALLLTDIRTHIKNWKTILVGLGIALLLALPYIRFIVLHPDENMRHLEILDSYWIQSIPLTEKLGIYFKEYLKLINPLYWFMPNDIDLERHVMKDYGHLLRWTLPLYALGFGIALRRITKPEYRLFLIATFAAPAGAALASAGVTRALFMVTPAVVLTAIGLDQLMRWIEKIKVPRPVLIGVVFIGLSVFSGFMLRDALVNGPRWFSNYSLGGQQYGASQIFTEIKKMLQENPDQKIYLSPSWANGTDVLARYFFDDPLPFAMGSVDSYLLEKRAIAPGQIFILIPEELERAKASNKLKPFEIIKTTDYPNGEPGFYFVHLEYIENVDTLFVEEEALRQRLSEAEIVDSQGRSLIVSYPQLDMGEIINLFDGNGDSLVRTLDNNPMRLLISPTGSLQVNQIAIRIGGTASTITIQITPEDGSEVVELVKEIPESNDVRDIIFDLEKPMDVESISISVLNIHDTDRAHVHVWEVTLN